MEPQNIHPQEQKQIEQTRICKFYLKKKRRQCKFIAIKGSQYCHSHCSDLQGRVECPYQKGMYIEASKLEKHLQVCPKIHVKRQQMKSEWYQQGVNLQHQAKKVTTITHLSNAKQEDIGIVIKKLISLFQKKFDSDVLSYLITTQQQKIQDKTNDHIQAYLLAEAAYNAKLINENTIYLEFGAGKGILSYAIALKVKQVCKIQSKNVLLQRQVRRHKFDNHFKDNPFFQRFKSDVADFDVHKLPQIMANTAYQKNSDIKIQQITAQINQNRIVGVCKHMCGAALDISVRALMKTKMNGCVLASCCHHLCSYETYLNNQFFQKQNFSPQQIQIIFKLSSWGTKSSIIEEKDIQFEQLKEKDHKAMSLKEKVVIGRMCKRLIDLGRAQILKSQVIRYCSDQITPQNFVILHEGE